MKKFSIVFLCLLIISSLASAGAKIDMGEAGTMDVGLRVQTFDILSEKDLDSDGQYDSYDDFKVRRGRIILNATFNERLSGYICTELGNSGGGTGQEARVIDAFLTLKIDDFFQILPGINMAPSSRYEVVSAVTYLVVRNLTHRNSIINFYTESMIKKQ